MHPPLPASRSSLSPEVATERPPPLPPARGRDLWKHRVHNSWHCLLARISTRPRAHVLLLGWTGIETAILRSARHCSYRFTHQAEPTTAGLEESDVVVPLSLEAMESLRRYPAACARNPLPLPAATAVALCDDKGRFDERMREAGLSQFVPEEPRLGAYPYILKRRHDSDARHAFRIASYADEMRFATQLRSPDYHRQAWIEGSREYAAHVLYYGGRIRHMVTVAYDMQRDAAIRGQHAITSRALTANRFGTVFGRMLDAAGYEGLCCVNYKVRDGIPIVMEINPRMGVSATAYLFSFVRHFDWRRHPAR